MKERGTVLVPSLSSVLSFGQPGDYADPPLFLRGQHMGPRRVAMVRRAYDLGIPIVVGADTQYGPESTARISRTVTFMMLDLGFDPLYALQAATSRAAELLGIADRTGVVREGFEADLLVIERDSLEHPYAIQDPLIIMSSKWRSTSYGSTDSSAGWATWPSAAWLWCSPSLRRSVGRA